MAIFKAMGLTPRRTRKELHTGTLRDCLLECWRHTENTVPEHYFAYFDGQEKYYHVHKQDDNERSLVAWIVWPKDEKQWRENLY